MSTKLSSDELTTLYKDHNVTNVNLEYCSICGVLSTQKKLVSSVTNTEYTNTKESRKLFCTDCFFLKVVSELCVREREKIIENQGFTTELQVNRRKESKFRLYVYDKLQETKNKRWEERDLVNSSAEVIGISTTTARRYLDKLCSSAGVLIRKDDGENIHVTYNIERLLPLFQEFIKNRNLGGLE
jgi:hypothetical protein